MCFFLVCVYCVTDPRYPRKNIDVSRVNDMMIGLIQKLQSSSQAINSIISQCIIFLLRVLRGQQATMLSSKQKKGKKANMKEGKSTLGAIDCERFRETCTAAWKDFITRANTRVSAQFFKDLIQKYVVSRHQ